MANTVAQSNAVDDQRERSIIAFLGSSSTAGRGQAFNWMEELKKRPQNKQFDFRNFGVGGDLAHNALERLPTIATCRPGSAVVWIGANDVLAITFASFYRGVKHWKHLPEPPSPQSFSRTLNLIVERLKGETPARIGICSLAPIGEDLSASDPPQSTLNHHIARFNAIIQETAQRSNVQYIPIYETIGANMKECPKHALSSFRFLHFYRDAFRAVVLRLSSDQIAALNGWNFHSDGVHLNGRSGMIVADLMQDFISS